MTAPEKIDLPYLHAEYQAELGVLFCRWRTPVTLEQFTAGYMAVLHLANLADAHYWLHDMRLRNTPDEAEKHWFSATFAPAVQNMLGNRNYIAYLMSPLQHEHLLEDLKPLVEEIDIKNHLTVCYYTNEHDALEWLSACRHRALA